MLPETSIRSLLEALNKDVALLSSPGLQMQLRYATQEEAAALRGGLLSVAAFLDDSVSNPELGSLFDLRSDTPLNMMRRHIADVYGVMETIPGTNGTTGLNTPAVMSLIGENREVAIGRDAHVSVHAGVVLSGARPVYIMPPFSPEFGVLLPISPEDVYNVLEANPSIGSVVLTLPTYHGLQGDVNGIVEMCHERGVSVMVDEAHGPHYRFLSRIGFPPSAEEVGADLITQSTHKVLSALNQGSLIHFNSLELFLRYEELQSLGFVSTSFSYPILISIEHAINQIVTRGEKMWTSAVKAAARLREAAALIPHVRVLDEQIVNNDRIRGIDPTRITLNVRESPFNGFEVAEHILEEGGIVEMATPDVVLFLVSPGVSEDHISATIAALKRVLSGTRGQKTSPPFIPPPAPEQVLSPREAMISARERLSVNCAIGRVSAETIGCYPPGQAIIIAGERITQEIVEYLKQAVRTGAHLKRVRDDHFTTIEVVCNELESAKLFRTEN
jgi:arginine decarboxylase